MADADQEQVPILSRLRPPAGAVRSKRRRGRGPGSGLGKTAGKGQKARHPGDFSKLGFEGGQMPLYRRIPKRGFVNIATPKAATVNVSDLNRCFDAGAVVDLAALRAAGLVRRRVDVVKVLGQGELDKALTVRANGFSASAKSKIDQAGGSTEIL